MCKGMLFVLHKGTKVPVHIIQSPSVQSAGSAGVIEMKHYVFQVQRDFVSGFGVLGADLQLLNIIDQ